MEPLTDEQKALAGEERSLAGADMVAARFAKVFPEHAGDIQSSAAWGVIRAAATFVPDEDNVWEKWSKMHAKYAVLDFLRSQRVMNSEQWDGQVIITPHQDERLVDPKTLAEPELDTLDCLIADLPDKYKPLLEKIYEAGMNAGEAGIALGYSEKHGFKMHREALCLLKDRLTA